MRGDLPETLARSATYKLLSLAFLPPGLASDLELLSGLPRIIQSLPEVHRQGLEPLTRELPGAHTEEPRAGEYTRLFSAGLAASPYESEYDPLVSARKGHCLADLLGFYEAFGFRLAGDLRDFPDHIAVELEFMSVLLLKTAHAAAESRDGAREVSEQAVTKFLEDHLASWGRAFADRVEAASESPFYRFAAQLLRGFLFAECSMLELEPPRLAPVIAGDPGPLACPFAPECPDALG